MMTDLSRLYDAVEATWPAAHMWQQDGWTMRDGAGGGKRVSAATAERVGVAPRGPLPDLVMVREREDRLDATLEAAGHQIIDPVIVYQAPCAPLARLTPPGIRTITATRPLARMRQIWADGGIGEARLAVMERVQGPKTYAMGRVNDRIAACAFAACHEDIVMLHALEVSPAARRSGLGRDVTAALARWGELQGAKIFALLATIDNAPARALYEGLGMVSAGQYHYRTKPRG